ncbi:MAG TPA: carbohydrate porin, partial [Kofleriaceae bacterium]|nr:carbohydrate porin [Kofleriaceae bacterium]
MRLALFVMLLASGAAYAGGAEPSPRDDDQFDVMNALARRHLHDLEDETWNAYGQVTFIDSIKLPFHAPYSGTHSLSPDLENSFTATATVFAGVRLWQGGELYIAPEAVSEQPLSSLHGLGGVIQNFELQKGGTPAPVGYIGRLYFQQTIELGGGPETIASNPLALGKTIQHDRITFTVGRFSVLDFLDKNTYSGDLRRQFFNMAFMTYAPYDFPADTRGYTVGANVEVVVGDWSFRASRAAPPKQPNQTDLEYRFWKYYGDAIEIEHDHELAGYHGAVRVLAFRNHENMGKFTDATDAYVADPSKNAAECGDLFHYDSTDQNAPDLCWARKPNDKVGIGINIEQAVSSDIGVFLRAMIADGRTEVYSFTPTDRSISLGALALGKGWGRPDDYAGVGFGAGGISDEHATYLRLGGIDGFIGDGKL